MKNEPLSVRDMMLKDHHPTTWETFVGQERAKKQLQILSADARKTGGMLGHTLLFSPEPGIGKTSLALLTAETMGRRAIILNSKMNQHQFQFQLLHLSDGDIVVWDEAQQQFSGSRNTWEWMLNYMQHGLLADGRGRPKDAPRVSFIMATTDKGLLAETVLERFQSVIELKPYTPNEQVLIAAGAAARIMGADGLPMPDVATCAAIATAANGKPRIINRLFKHLKALAGADEVTPYDNGDGSFAYEIDEVLAWEGVSEDGLNQLEQQYMLFLFDNEGDPVGKDRIFDHLREDMVAFKRTERTLMDKGYVEVATIGKSGRVLTDNGLHRAKDLSQMGEN